MRIIRNLLWGKNPVAEQNLLTEEENEAETVVTTAEDVAEPGDWDDALDFDINLPDGNAAAEMAADDITSADDIASMEIELPDLDLFTGLGTLDVNTEETVPADPPKNFGRDTGRSGKKYTAEELEALIKE